MKGVGSGKVIKRLVCCFFGLLFFGFIVLFNLGAWDMRSLREQSNTVGL